MHMISAIQNIQLVRMNFPLAHHLTWWFSQRVLALIVEKQCGAAKHARSQPRAQASTVVPNEQVSEKEHDDGRKNHYR